MKFNQVVNEVFNSSNLSQSLDQIETQITSLKKGMTDIQANEKEVSGLKQQIDKLNREKQIALQQQAAMKNKQGIQKIPITKAQTPQQMAGVSVKADRIAQA